MMSSDNPFKAFAERHDLDYAGQVAPGVATLPRGVVGPVAGGQLPGGLNGIVAPLSQELKPTRGTVRYFRDSVLVMTRVPESATLFPYVTCRDVVTRGFADRMIGPGGLIPIVDHVEFESIELGRRYRIGALKGTSENLLRQLFSPTLIDWMAHVAPEGIYFELFAGLLVVTVTGHAAHESDIADACGLATHLADRIRAEAVESISLEGALTFNVPPEQSESERSRAETLAESGFGEPPRTIGEALDRIEPVVKRRSKGLLRKVFKGIDRDEAESLALEAVIRAYGREHNLGWQRPIDFLFRQSGSPLPLAAEQALRGRLPGLDVVGDLFVLKASVEDQPVLATGATLPWPDRDAVALVTPGGEQAQSLETIGGFPVSVVGGERRMGASSQRDAKTSEHIEEELLGRYAVTARDCVPGQTITPELCALLLDESRPDRAIVTLAGGTLTLMSLPLATETWSVSHLDELAESLKPLAP